MVDAKNNAEKGRLILEEATDYYLALQDDSISDAELRAWQHWFVNSREHRIAFRRLEALWGVLEHVSVDAFSEISKSDIIEQEEKPVEATSFKGGSVISLITKDLKSKPEAPKSWRVWATSMAAGFAAIFIASYVSVTPGSIGSSNPSQLVYETTSTSQQVVRLADGSIVELGPDSQVSVEYTDEERFIDLLKGQAVFTVAKNPNRPFVVKAGLGTVTALGTVFNVSHDSSGDINVKVLEGTVAVRPLETVTEGHEAIIVPEVALVTSGNKTSYSEEAGLMPVESADLAEGLTWRVGVLRMVDRKLSDVIFELNRYVENEISIGDDTVGEYYFTGTVYPDQVDAWLEGLQLVYPVKVIRVGSSTILMQDENS